MYRTLPMTVWFVCSAVLAAALTPADLPQIDRFDQQTTAYLYRAGGQTLSEQLAGTPAAKAGESADVQAWFAELDRMGTLERKGVRLYRFIRQAYKASHVYVARVADPLDPDEEPLVLPEIGQHYLALITPAPDQRDAISEAFKDLRATNDADEMREGGDKLMLGYDGWRIHLKRFDDTIAWATDNDLLEALELPPLDKLSESEHFRASVQPLLAGQEKLPIALYYYDLRPLWQPLDAEDYKLWNDLSWRGIDAVAGATFVRDGRFFNRHYWKLGKNRTGLLRKTEDHRLRRDWFKAVPNDASLVVSGVWRAGSFIASLRLLNAWLSGSQNAIADNINLPREMAPQQMNLQTIGSRYLLYRRPTRYTAGFFAPGLLPTNDLVLMVELADRDYFIQSMSMLQQLPNFERSPTRRHQYAGSEVTSISFGLFSLYIAKVDDVGILTTNGQLMKDALDQFQALNDTPADTASGVLSALKNVPDEACFFAYAPPGGIVRGLYDTYAAHLVEMPCMSDLVRSMGAFLFARDQLRTQPPDTGVVFDVLAIPRGRELAIGVRQPTTLVGRDLGDGILFEGSSDLIAMPLLVTHLHALSRFHNAPIPQSLLVAFDWMLTPAEPLKPQEPEPGP